MALAQINPSAVVPKDSPNDGYGVLPNDVTVPSTGVVSPNGGTAVVPSIQAGNSPNDGFGVSPSNSPNDGFGADPVTASSTTRISTVVVPTTVTSYSNGQIYTTTVASTITQMVIDLPTAAPTDSSKTNIGVIVGSAVGGVGGLIIFSLLVVFWMRKRRKDAFDGNFDPANVGSVKGGGGGTLPEMDLEEDGLLLVNNEVEVYEDDGMGGRLGAGPVGGGIIMPYSFQPAPVGSTAVGQQYRNHPQMQQISNIGVAADGVDAALAAGYPNRKRATRMRQQHTQHTPNQFIPPAFEAYLRTGPHRRQQYQSPSSPTADPFQTPTLSRADTAVVVHDEDGGRVVLRKGEEAEGEGEVLNPEIPPTYDSLLVDVRRDS